MVEIFPITLGIKKSIMSDQLSIDANIKTTVYNTYLQPMIHCWYLYMLTGNDCDTLLDMIFKLKDTNTKKLFCAFMISYASKSPFTILLLRSCLGVLSIDIMEFLLIARKVRLCNVFKLKTNKIDDSISAIITYPDMSTRITSPILAVHISSGHVHFITLSGTIYYGDTDTVEHFQHSYKLPHLISPKHSVG